MIHLRSLIATGAAIFAQACHSTPADKTDGLPASGQDSLCLAYNVGYGLKTSTLWCADGKCTSVEAIPPQPGAFRVAVRSGPISPQRLSLAFRLALQSTSNDKAPTSLSSPSIVIRQGRSRVARDFFSRTPRRSSTDSLAQWFREIRGELKPTIWSDSLVFEIGQDRRIRYRLMSGAVSGKWLGQNPTLRAFYAERLASGDPVGHPTWTRSDKATKACIDDLLSGGFCEFEIPPTAKWVRAQFEGSPQPESPIPDGTCFHGHFELGTDWVELRR